ncbi:MAG: universal stress protein [Chitinophagales bacterium]|nr:universal stress protein [Chitinophagales bacterium]
MKNIIVPTDFSKKAQYAAEMAFDLAKLMECKVRIVHRKSPDSSSAEALNKIDSIHKIPAGLEKEIMIVEGELMLSLENMIKSEGECIVIMGSQGKTNAEDLNLGSQAQKAVRLLDCPVIVVNSVVDISKFDSIIFASNFNTEAKSSFEIVMFFARLFKSEIHLLTIDAPAFFNLPRIIVRESMRNFKEMAGDVKCHIHDFPDKSVIDGIEHFVQKVGADILTIGTYGKKTSRIFSGSIAEAMIGKIEIPVMTINMKN